MGSLTDELGKFLTGTMDQDDPSLPPRVLQAAFAWCAAAITSNRLVNQTHGEIVLILAELLQALKIGREYLSTATPGLLQRVVAGERLKDAVQDHQSALEAGARELEQLHEALLSLSQREGQLRAQATEREALATRRAELEHLARLAEGVEELRRQVEALETHLPPAGREVEVLERHIEARAQRLIVLSERTLAHVGRSVRAALELAEQKERERYEVGAQLRSATERYKQAEIELATLREPLRLYLEADRVVAQALPGAQTARGILDEAERLLQQADQALQQVLAAHAKAQRLDRLSFSGGKA